MTDDFIKCLKHRKNNSYNVSFWVDPICYSLISIYVIILIISHYIMYRT
jgi:hypothetical protein